MRRTGSPNRGRDHSYGAFRVVRPVRPAAFLPQIGAILAQLALQSLDIDIPRAPVRFDGDGGGRAGRLPRHEASARHARSGLAHVRHGRATTRDQEVVDALRHDHPVRQVVEASAGWNVLPLEKHVARDMGLHHPAVDADRVVETRAGEDIAFGQLIFADASSLQS